MFQNIGHIHAEYLYVVQKLKNFHGRSKVFVPHSLPVPLDFLAHPPNDMGLFHSTNGNHQWRTQEFFSGGGFNKSVEDREQRERGSGGVAL
jgi:hypothetical protein